MRVWHGKPYPLGATWDGQGVNFSIFSENATSVELLLFENQTSIKPRYTIPLTERTGTVWHAYLPDANPGQLYQYSIDGPFDPHRGLRFNKNKALIDPYAKAILGRVTWDDSVFSYIVTDEKKDLSFDARDSAQFVPKCVVVDTAYDWEGDRLLKVPWDETIIYEAHVKGLTKLHPGVAENERGTYAGLASPKIIDHLKTLGITAIELLPIQQHVDTKELELLGLGNYWGYNTIGYFAPHGEYSSSGAFGGQVKEFKDMVKKLHKAGIEVILDVVYNHTGEGDQLGPTICFRGIDNTSYYRLKTDDRRFYLDFTGTGNSLNVRQPIAIQLIMDSLRYWVLDMHVDGFRFDLASALAREVYEVDRLSTFFEVIQQDPIISQVKLIAEPWDIGPSGYQVGNFPELWSEWNGKYRDAVRRFWRGDEIPSLEIENRLTGSSDLYEERGRKPLSSINYVTCHDGFTLADLVSYNSKHNEANGESGRDGTDDNISWNWGAEGQTEDVSINEVRARQAKNFLATLLLSQGVPMVLAGDEIGRTQKGNNNAFSQDNETSWLDWNLTGDKEELLEFTRRVIRLRKSHPALRRKNFFRHPSEITWFSLEGSGNGRPAQTGSTAKAIGMEIFGDAMLEYDDHGQKISDDTIVILLNASRQMVTFQLPDSETKWERVLETVSNERLENKSQNAGEFFQLYGLSLAVMMKVSN
jgi:isoamylase